MITKKRTLTDAFDRNLLLKEGYKFIWMQSINKVSIGKLSEIDYDPDTLLEARIIGSDKEIHLFEYQDFKSEDRLRAIETILEEGDDYIDTQKQLLRRKYGNYVVLRHVLDKDSDGQVYVVRSMLADYGKGEN